MVVLLFPVELRFKELQVKVHQPNRISLSSEKVQHAQSHFQWQGTPLAPLPPWTLVSDLVLSKLKYRQAPKMKGVLAQINGQGGCRDRREGGRLR